VDRHSDRRRSFDFHVMVREFKWPILLGIILGVVLWCITEYIDERAWQQLEYELSQVHEVDG